MIGDPLAVDRVVLIMWVVPIGGKRTRYEVRPGCIYFIDQSLVVLNVGG